MLGGEIYQSWANFKAGLTVDSLVDSRENFVAIALLLKPVARTRSVSFQDYNFDMVNIVQMPENNQSW